MAAASAIAFATLAILGKFAYAAGMTVAQLLALRFLLATVAMLAVSTMVDRRALRLGSRRLLALFALGAGCYGLQSAMFFGCTCHFARVPG